MREYIMLQCRECERLNYRTSRQSTNTRKLELKKHCPKCRRHTVHREKKK